MKSIFLVFALLFSASNAWAQALPIIRYEVTSTGNSGGGTLRGAIEYFDSYSGPPYLVHCEVFFAQDLNGATITVSGSPLSITSPPGVASVTVDASNLEDGITISGGGTTGVFYMDYESHLNLTKVCIVDGAALDGAGILNEGGVLWMNDCTIANCTASGWGGAIVNVGTADLTNCTIYNCEAQEAPWDDSGAVLNFGELSMQNCTVTGNDSGILSINYEGGIIEVGLRNTVVAGNNGVDVSFAGDDVPAVNHYTSWGNNLIGLGNAVDGSTFTQPGDVTGVADPMLGALADNGGPCPTCLPLPGSPAIDGATGPDPNTGDWQLFPPPLDQRLEWRGVGAAPDIGAVEVRQEIVVTTLADSGPGSLRNAMSNALSGMTVVFDPSLDGQAIRLKSGGLSQGAARLQIDGSSLFQGITISGRGQSGVFKVRANEELFLKALNISDGYAFYGAGVNVAALGRLRMMDCAIINCHAPWLDDFTYNATGAGLYCGGEAVVENCTFYGNRSDGIWRYKRGAAIFCQGYMTLVHCTVFGNEGGLLLESIGAGAEMKLRGCVVSGNETGDVSWLDESTYHLNNYSSFGNNLVGAGDAIDGTVFTESGDFPNVTNPGLGVLLNNGGLTLTCLPQADSPLIDAALTPTISNTDWLGPPFSTDQRGFGRPVGALRDIGAVERQPSDTDGVSYAAYASANGLVEDIALANGDGNDNGIPDIFDYGLNYLADGQGRHSPRVSMDAGGPVLRIPLSSSGRPDTLLTVRACTDLGSGDWVTIATKSGEGEWTGDSEVYEAFPSTLHREARVRPPASLSSSPKLFFQVGVSENAGG